MYLEPTASYGIAQRLARDEGEPIPVGPKTLAKRLDERGLLVSADRAQRRRTTRRDLEGARRRVLHIATGTLITPELGQSDQTE